MKIPKRNFWGGVGSGMGVMVDVNREVKSCENSKKKIFFGGFWGGGRVRGGVRMDVYGSGGGETGKL